MKIKFLQVNIFKGQFLDELMVFIREQDPDIITMQEVSGGQLNLSNDKSVNLFDVLKKELGYDGVFHSDVEMVGDPSAKFGNTVFSKWPIISSNVIAINTFRPITLAEFKGDFGVWAKFTRHMLSLLVDLEGTQVNAISFHGRRIAPPVDDGENLRQAKIVAEYLKSLGGSPFIVGGDFNMPAGSQTIGIVSGVSNNLMDGSGVKQTLNPKVHELGENGYLVDFIFTSKHFKKISLEVPQVTVSDHLPVIAELELET